MLPLSAETRRSHLETMAEGSLDLLVIGGGITGAGVSLDAVTRGLRVALLEREDFAAGTSGRSSRLIHGGIRYLRRGEMGLVRESRRERDLLVRLAPHLVRPMPFLIPTRRLGNRVAIRAGLRLYDLLTLRSALPGHRRVDDEEGCRIAPALVREGAGYVYWDARTDDARLTLEVVRQAAARGALVANHAEVTALDVGGRLGTAEVADHDSGSTLTVRAQVVVNATGAWADRVLGLAGAPPPRLRPSKGVHLVFDRARVPLQGGLLVPSVEGGGAFVFVIPWGARVFAGTTDTPYEGDLTEPSIGADADIVLASVDGALRADLSEGDVLASWAGVRPLLDTGRGTTRDLSRRHLVREDPPGLVTVTGGKLTTYRAMAEETVDRVCGTLRVGRLSRADLVPLGFTPPLPSALDRAAEESRRLGQAPAFGHRLVSLYGDDWPDAMRMVEEDASLAEPVVDGLPVRRVEVLLARTREMALTERDILERRTRLSVMDARAARDVRL